MNKSTSKHRKGKHKSVSSIYLHKATFLIIKGVWIKSSSFSKISNSNLRRTLLRAFSGRSVVSYSIALLRAESFWNLSIFTDQHWADVGQGYLHTVLPVVLRLQWRICVPTVFNSGTVRELYLYRDLFWISSLPLQNDRLF